MTKRPFENETDVNLVKAACRGYIAIMEHRGKKIKELEQENETLRHSDKLLSDVLEQRENEILKLKKIIKKVCFDDDKQAAWDYLNKQGKEE